MNSASAAKPRREFTFPAQVTRPHGQNGENLFRFWGLQLSFRPDLPEVPGWQRNRQGVAAGLVRLEPPCNRGTKSQQAGGGCQDIRRSDGYEPADITDEEQALRVVDAAAMLAWPAARCGALRGRVSDR